MKRICYTPVKGIDDTIANKVQGWNKYMVANLRGLYDEKNTSNLETQLDNAIQNKVQNIPSESMSIEDLTQALIDFRKQLSKEDFQRFQKAITSPEVSYMQLKEAFNAEERYNRVSMISTMFSDIVDGIQEEYPTKSRGEIISGFESDGKIIGGLPYIFTTIREGDSKSYDDDSKYYGLQDFYNGAVEDGDLELASKYQSIFDNWGALISFAKIRIKNTEDIKLGQNLNFVDNANPNSFNDNDLSEKFTMEESKREGWMENSEFESSFGSVGKQVRKVIGRIPKYKDGQEVVDDLGFPVMQDPVKIHQELLDVLRGISNESEMLATLKEYSTTTGWVTTLMEELDNPQIRTQFFTNFKKNFQPYSEIIEKTDGKLKSYKTFIINKIKGGESFKLFLTSIKAGKEVNPKNSIYNKTSSGNKISPIRVERLRNSILEYLSQNTNNVLDKPKFWKVSRVERKSFLIDSLESLGIDIDGDTLDKIMSKNRDLRGLLKNLLDTADFGLGLTNEEKSGNKSLYYEELIKRSSSNSKEGVLREKLSKILTIISKFKEGLKMESRARYQDNTFFSNVIPSFLGDRMDLIENFVKNGNSRGLKSFIENTYFKSSYFYDKSTGKILNKWLEELYNSDLSKDGNFAENFSFKRFLGSDILEFDNFTRKQHVIQMMQEFFSERQISPKSQYAWYPVFILGDSGVAKFIKAKRYGSQEILDGLYNVYLQEIERMKIAKASSAKLNKEGFKAIDNFSKNDNKFTLLPFLNSDYINKLGEKGKYSNMINSSITEQSVKEAIMSYMRDSVDDFKTQMEDLGILKEENNQYVYLNQEVKDNNTIDKVLADFYWNTKFATIQQLQMMTIDPAFYKGTKDLQKRYKEIHAPGSLLSIEAVNPWTRERYSEYGIERVVYFNDIEVNAEDIDPKFMDAIANHFGRNSDIYKKYRNNTLTDGQGYRTLKSYRNVMGMAGQWAERMELAYNQIQTIKERINEDENPSMEDIESLSDLAVIFQPIKPYLFTFENYAINNNEVMQIPVQHKYAEVVIIPELLPAGSKLRDIAYWMENEDNNIDLLCSTTCVKVGGFGATDISNSNSDAIKDDLSKGYIHQLNYSDYRIQTNVPEHINSSQLFGTQVRKLIMAGVQRFKDYSSYIGENSVNIGGTYGKVKLNGGNLVRFYNSLISANIIDSFNMFESSTRSINDVSNRLIQTTANNTRESKDNLFSYALDADGKRFTVPLFEGGLEHDSSALLFSLFKKMVNKQAIKGGSAVQASAMGIDSYKEDGGLQYVVDPNNPNNIQYVECEIPWDLSYTDMNGNEISLDYNHWVNEDGTIKLNSKGTPLIEDTYPNILSMIAYRIPTERDYSMINLRVVRFSNKMSGGTIKVPPQGTTIAGFDFDIDKLYFMRREFKGRKLTKSEKDGYWKEIRDNYGYIEGANEDTLNDYIYQEGIVKFEEYDFEKTPLENSKATRNNMLISLIQARLSDFETFGNRYTPGGFSNASKAARFMRELMFGKIDIVGKTVNLSEIQQRINDGITTDPEPNYDPSDPMTIITYNQQNNVAGKLIGIFANQNTNHAFASLMDDFQLKEPIQFAGSKPLSDLLNNPDIDTSLNVAEFLAASVDAVKDPVLNFLNLNTVTADAGAMLARLGFTTEQIGLLFNQPIIKDICEFSFNNNMSDINSVIDNVLNAYDVEEVSNVVPYSDYSKERLAYNIVRASSQPRSEWSQDSEFKNNQIHVANLFRKILEDSNDVSNFVRNTKFTASNAVGSTFGDSYSQQMKISNYIESFKNKDKLRISMKVAQNISSPMMNGDLSLNNQEYLESLLENPFAYEQAMYDMNRKANQLLNKYYPYNNSMYSELRKYMAKLTKGGILDSNTINNIHSDLVVYLLNQQENSLFNGNETSTDKIHSNREYYLEVFPNNLYSKLESSPELKNMPIFQYMQFQTDEDTGKVSINIQDIGGLAPHQKDELKESWGDLADNPNTKELAEGLFLYNYYKLGFTYSPLAFMNLAPTQVKLNIQVGTNYDGSSKSYIDFLNDILDGRQNETSPLFMQQFAQQYILNHLDNPAFAFTVKGNSRKIINKLAFQSGLAKSEFTLNTKSLGKDANPFIISSKKGETIFRPAIIVDGVVYIADGEGGAFNISNSESIVYRQKEPLGESKKSLQYFSTSRQSFVSSNSTITPESSTNVEPEVFRNELENIPQEWLVDAIIDYAKATKQEISDYYEFAKTLQSTSLSTLIDTIKANKIEVIDKKTGKPLC